MARRFGPQNSDETDDGDRDELPWLGPATESFEDDEERMIPRSWLLGGLALFLLLLGGLVAFIYFRVARPGADTSGGTQTALVDPDTLPLIKADLTPIRERPTDPGGMKVDGQDLKVLDVASGEQPNEPTQLAQGSETPVDRTLPPATEPPAPIPPAAKPTPPPVVATAPAPAPVKPAVVPTPPRPKPVVVAQAPAPAPKPQPAVMTPKPTPAPAPAAARGGVYLQLGAFSTRDRANSAWGQAKGKFAGLGGLSSNVQEAGPTKFRLRAGPVSSRDEAQRICGELKAQGQPCIPAS